MKARISRITVLLSAVMIIMGIVLAGSAFAGASDNVLSGNIREADGSTGQNTNTGSGVKTGHIQDGAVTAPKLGIVCPDGQYLQYTIASGWVCSVGTPGPEGPQGPQGPVGPAPHYANVIVVAKSGGDFTDPVAALNSISDASETNPYLVKVLPGIYTISGAPVQMKPYVDLEGSGVNVTKIVGILNVTGTGIVAGAGYSEIRSLTVEYRNTGQYEAVAIWVKQGFQSRITNVTAIASGTSTQQNIAIYNEGYGALIQNTKAIASGSGVHNIGIQSLTSITLIDVDASATGGSGYNSGIEIWPGVTSPCVLRNVTATAVGGSNRTAGIRTSSSIEMVDVKAVAKEGVINIGLDFMASGCPQCTFNIEQSSITGSTAAFTIYSDRLPFPPFNEEPTHGFLATTKLDGGMAVCTVDPISVLLKCFGVYNGNYEPVICDPLPRCM
ncbi:MAG: hypothetical protein ACM34I_13075 [bacterium]